MATVSVQGGVGTESFGDINFVVTLSAPVTELVSVKYRTLPGTAFSEVDYRPEEGTLLFSPGETTKTVGISMRSDGEVELDEAFFLELFDPTNAEFLRGLPTLRATGWLLDNDNLGNTRAIQVSSPMIVETDTDDLSLNFNISLSKPFATDVELDYRTVDGSAVAGKDFEKQSGKISFFAGQTEAVVTVRTTADRIIEGPEHFYLAVTPDGALGSGAVGAIGRATILDNDSGGRGPVVHVEGGRQTEGFASLPFTVTLSESSRDAVTVKYRTLSGTATEDVDFTRNPSFGEGVLTFAPGETSKTLDVRLRSDGLQEVDEAVVLDVYEVANASFGGGRRGVRATGWILEDGDNVGNKRALFVSSPIVEERAITDTSYATFDISLSRPSTERISMRYQTVDNSARSGSDFKAASGSVVFEPGQTETSVQIRINDDAREEPVEAFQLRLIPPIPAQVGSGVAGIFGTATIIDSTIVGTSGPDTLVGTVGDDVINGRGGGDQIFGLAGDDIIFGEGGADEIDGGRGKDRMTGGSGDDEYAVDNKGDRVVERAKQGDDTVAASIDYKLGDHVENLSLTGRRSIDGDGNDADNVIRGNAASNTLDGGRGDDTISAGNGKDTVIGGLGIDRLSGGQKADVFMFRSERDSGVGKKADRITDFERGVDQLDLTGLDGNDRRNGNQELDYIGSSQFSKDNGEARFKNGLFQVDIDGDGRSDFDLRIDDVGRLGPGDLVL